MPTRQDADERTIIRTYIHSPAFNATLIGQSYDLGNPERIEQFLDWYVEFFERALDFWNTGGYKSPVEADAPGKYAKSD